MAQLLSDRCTRLEEEKAVLVKRNKELEVENSELQDRVAELEMSWVEPWGDDYIFLRALT